MELSSRVHVESVGRKITEDYRECLNFRHFAAAMWEGHFFSRSPKSGLPARSVSRETFVQVFMSVRICNPFGANWNDAQEMDGA
jgi:hypothetical protein